MTVLDLFSGEEDEAPPLFPAPFFPPLPLPLPELEPVATAWTDGKLGWRGKTGWSESGSSSGSGTFELRFVGEERAGVRFEVVVVVRREGVEGRVDIVLQERVSQQLVFFLLRRRGLEVAGLIWIVGGVRYYRSSLLDC